MSSWQRCIPVLVLALASVGFASPAQAVESTHHVVSIAQARTLPLGTVVTVDGVATTPSGAFESSFFDQGFGLQDRSAGIYVSVAVDPGITPRAQVRVTGTLRDSSGLRILVPDDPAAVVVHGKGPTVRPRRLATGAVGENSEGQLVRVIANTQTGIDLTGLAAGRTVSVTGFSSQFDTHYEIDPRFPADITTRHP